MQKENKPRYHERVTVDIWYTCVRSNSCRKLVGQFLTGRVQVPSSCRKSWCWSFFSALRALSWWNGYPVIRMLTQFTMFMSFRNFRTESGKRDPSCGQTTVLCSTTTRHLSLCRSRWTFFRKENMLTTSQVAYMPDIALCNFLCSRS